MPNGGLTKDSIIYTVFGISKPIGLFSKSLKMTLIAPWDIGELHFVSQVLGEMIKAFGKKLSRKQRHCLGRFLP